MKNTSGIYIHIPFCHSKCNYCNFYSLVSDRLLNEFTSALHKEIINRKDEIKTNISTIYFGGGTPSLLPAEWFDNLFELLNKHFSFANNIEKTIETNPDDLNPNYLKNISIYFNRLSIGIQSFNDEKLKYLNRKHTSQTAKNSIKNAQNAGFSNISVDLIYGVPAGLSSSFKSEIDNYLLLDVPHISAYSLTVEEKTKLFVDIEKHKINPTSEKQSISEYLELMETLSKSGFVQYEISNFAKKGMESKHNSSYWEETPYLGLGPAAHSYDGLKRRWNLSSISKYIQGVENNSIYFEEEILSETDKLNEYIMTGLRTHKGMDLNIIENRWGLIQKNRIEKELLKMDSNFFIKNTKNLILSNNGKLFADRIASDLFY